VSDFGNVRRLARTAVCRNGASRPLETKTLAPFTSHRGYTIATLTREGVAKKRPVHRLVAESFIANPSAKPEVNHIDLDKQNNCLNNLEWATRLENAKHATDLGRNSAATNSLKQRKLDHEKVLKIKSLLQQNDLSFADIGSMFGVSSLTISKISKGSSWSVPGEDKIQRKKLPPGIPKITQEIADTIRAKLKQGFRGSDLAREYSISPMTVSDVKRNVCWVGTSNE
jgi:predicted XRE-type DNA-binding protein